MGVHPLVEKTLQFAQVGGEVVKRYESICREKKAQAASVSQKIPAVLTALLEGDRIFEHQKEAVAAGLTSHEACLDLLTKLATHRNSQEMATMGMPTGGIGGQTKQASHRPVGSTVVDYDETEAGQKFRQILLGGN